MIKQPFSPEGLQALLSSLYQLPDVALQVEAGAIAANFRLWLEHNFDLLPDQLSYLLAIDDRQIANVAANGQYFVVNRLPILLIKAEMPATQLRNTDGKYFEVKKVTTSSFAPVAGYSEEEILTITISYA